MTAQDYIFGTVKITDPAIKELVQMVKELQKENLSLRVKVSKLEDDIRYYRTKPSYDNWDGGGGF